MEDLIGKNLCSNKIFTSNNLRGAGGVGISQFGSRFLMLRLKTRPNKTVIKKIMTRKFKIFVTRRYGGL